MGRIVTKEIFNDELEAAGRSVRLIGDYLGSKKKTLFKDACGHTWKAVPNSIKNGSGCPTCYGTPKLSKAIVNQRLEAMGSSVREIGGYHGMHAKTEFECLVCGHKFQTKPNNPLKCGSECPVCAENIAYTSETYNAEIASRGYTCPGFVKSTEKAIHYCSEGHKWLAKPLNVAGATGSGCPYCVGQIKYTLETYNAKIEPMGIRGLSYERMSTKAPHECLRCGYIWQVKPGNILHSESGCPACATYGFDPAKPAIVYYVKVAGYLYKVGITNNDLKKRFSGETDLIEVIETIHFDTGADALAFEKEILEEFSEYIYTGPNVLKRGGNTELFTIDVLGLDKETV